MRSLRPVVTLVVAALISASCSSATRKAEGDGPHVKPPQLVTPGPRPDWRLPTPRDGMVIDLRIAVMVDSTGHADLATLKVQGLGAFENREAVAVWLASSLFRPAQQDDHPVSALYQTRVTVKVKTTVVRRG